MRARIGALVVVVFVVATFVWATAGGAPNRIAASLAGTINDASGAVLPGVTVEAKGPMTATAVTDARGSFRIVNLVPGDYTVTATLAGFSTTTTQAQVTASAHETASGASRCGWARLPKRSPSTGAHASRRHAQRDRPAGHRRQFAKLAASAAPAAIRPECDGRCRADAAPTPSRTSTSTRTASSTSAADPLSTFSVDVDTASYANVRRFLSEGRLPQPGAVRIEELINYFRYPTRRPTAASPSRSRPSSSECPWNPRAPAGAHRHPGARGCRRASRRRATSCSCIDVSGSMAPPDKLPLVQSAMRMLVDAARASATAWPSWSTPAPAASCCRRRPAPTRPRSPARSPTCAPGGSTNGAAGIQLAYRIAREHFIRGGVNRVILATDGDFNVGVTSQDALVRLIEQRARVGRVPVGARLRHRQPQGLHDGEAGRQGQRQLRLHRLAARGAQGAGERARRHARRPSPRT